MGAFERGWGRVRDLVSDPRNPLYTPRYLRKHWRATPINEADTVDTQMVALTFDVEQDFGLEGFLGKEWGNEKGLPAILVLLEEKDIHATFFIQQTVLDAHPDTIIEIAKSGHEVGFHGRRHEVWGDGQWWLPDKRILSSEEKRSHLIEGARVIEDITGSRPQAFRAPYMVANPETLLLLTETGFAVDSSATASLGIEPVPTRARGVELTELPVSADPSPSFRLLPYPHWKFDVLQTAFLADRGIEGTAGLMRRINAYQASKKVAPHSVMLCHPWEFVDHPELPDARFDYASKDNLHRLGGLIDALDVEWITMCDLARRLIP